MNSCPEVLVQTSWFGVAGPVQVLFRSFSGPFQVLFRSFAGPDPKKTRKRPEKDPKKTRKGPEKDPKRTRSNSTPTSEKTRKGPENEIRQRKIRAGSDPENTRKSPGIEHGQDMLYKEVLSTVVERERERVAQSFFQVIGPPELPLAQFDASQARHPSWRCQTYFFPSLKAHNRALLVQRAGDRVFRLVACLLLCTAEDGASHVNTTAAVEHSVYDRVLCVLLPLRLQT